MRILLLACLMMVPAYAQEPAQKGEDHKSGGHNEPSIAWKWANFALLAGVLGWLASKNLGPYFQSRNDEIQGGLREAARIREDAEARIAGIQKKVDNIDAEMKSMRQAALAEIAAEGERIRQGAAKAIAKIQQQAELEIASATKLARQELKSLSAELAIQLAAAQIRDRMTPVAQAKLMKDFVSALGQTRN